MRLTGILLFAVSLHASAVGFSQVTLKEKNVSLQKVFSEIHKQTGYDFVYTSELIESTGKVSVNVKNLSLEQALIKILQGSNLTYVIEGKIISIKQLLDLSVQLNDSRPAFNSEIPPGKIRGRVIDANGVAVAGVSILLKGSKRGTSTDSNGEFTLSVNNNDILIITGINVDATLVNLSGLQQKIESENGNIGDIVVSRLVKEEKEVVVAYNRISEKSNTGAVTVIKGEQIASLPNRSFDKSLQGLVPGLLVTSGSGQPGGSPANFVLRGIATGGDPKMGESFRNPLIVIDGVPITQEAADGQSRTGTGNLYPTTPPAANPLAHLNPSDIESISVLKDASAVALYGSRASNGVLLVTTKRGKAGKTVISFRSQAEFSSRLRDKVDLLSQQEYLELLYETYRNSTPGITDAQIFSDLFSTPSDFPPAPYKFPSLVNTLGDTVPYPDADWEGAMYKSPAVATTHEIGLSGGSDRTNFYFNLEYTKQNGIVHNTGFNRKSMRFNYDYRATPWFKISLNTTMSYNIQDYGDEATFLNLKAISPLNPIHNAEGAYLYNYAWGLDLYNSYNLPNPVASTQMNINRNTSFRSLSNITAELHLLKRFTLKSLAGIDYVNNENRVKVRPEFAILSYFIEPGLGMIRDISTRTASMITSNTLTYNQEFGDHNINILAGQEAQLQQQKFLAVGYLDISENPNQDQVIGKTLTIGSGRQFTTTLLSYFGQLNYSWRNRYFLTGSVRADGASQFGENEKFGSYWSVGAAWVLSDESFMKRAPRFLDYLKLRGSFGPAGNSAAISESHKFSLYSLASTPAGMFILPDRSRLPGNPSIKWEETFVWNGGVDMRMAKDRISLTVNYYHRETINIISEKVPLPISTGFREYIANIGDMRNTGVELSLSADVIKTETLKWHLSANWSCNRNKLTRANMPQQFLGNGITVNEVGREFNSFYMPIWGGVNPENGKPQWIDSTGKPSELYGYNYQFVGKAQPDGFGAINTRLSYRGIELSAMLYYQYGFQLYQSTPILLNDGLYPHVNQSREALDRWQKPGDIAKNPKRWLYGFNGVGMDMGTYPSTRFLSDGDFIRLSNVQLGYHLPHQLIRRIALSGCRIFVQGTNLATWTTYKGQDPENSGVYGQAGPGYPLQKTISIGLNANF